MKVLLILVDGMRPDAIADQPSAKRMMDKSAYSLHAQTVFPSVTLPCHMSLFHSVDPERHGTTTNTYAPQVRPIRGLFDVLAAAGKKCAFFYNWEELRDLSRPGALEFSYYCGAGSIGYEEANKRVTAEAISYLTKVPTDFAFLYLGYTDIAGHQHGWMSDGYMQSIDSSWNCIDAVLDALPEDWCVIVTADHGGHDRAHGTMMPEDMTIPMIIRGGGFRAGQQLADASIKDIAPTTVSLLGVAPDKDWEGKDLTAQI